MLTTEQIANFIVEYQENNDNDILSSQKLSALVLLFYGLEILPFSKNIQQLKDIVIIDKGAHLVSTEVMNAIYNVAIMPFNENHVITNDRLSFFSWSMKSKLTKFLERYSKYSVNQLYALFLDKIIHQQTDNITRITLSVFKDLFEKAVITSDLDISKNTTYFNEIDTLTINELNQFKLFLQRIAHNHPSLELSDMIALLDNNTLNIQHQVVKRGISAVFDLLNKYFSLASQMSDEDILFINKQLNNYTEEFKKCVISKEEFLNQINVIDKYFELKNNTNNH